MVFFAFFWSFNYCLDLFNAAYRWALRGFNRAKGSSRDQQHDSGPVAETTYAGDRDMRDILILYALQFVGLPYRWGGDDPILGFDCSGMMQEILAAAGIDPPGDQNANGLYNYFKKNHASTERKAGALIFYGDGKRVNHCGFFVSENHVIEAGSGNSKTTSSAMAARQNAYVRMRPYNARKDIMGIFFPLYLL